jgi:predicted phage terminase large subunit-like protein
MISIRGRKHRVRRTDISDRLSRWLRVLHDSVERSASAADSEQADQKTDRLLEWARAYLPDHVRLPPSRMHRWLAGQLDEMRTARGRKLNVVGPRGGAKSTIGSLAFVLRAAVEASEPYIWIVSDAKHQAVSHLENIKTELRENPRLLAAYPKAAGAAPVWRENSVRLANGVAIEAFGTGQRIRGRRRRADRPTLIICDDIQDDRHIESNVAREHSRRWFHGMLMKAGTKRTNVVNLATALHREALAMELNTTPGWTSRVFQAIERWPDRMDLWEQWERIYSDVECENARTAAREFYDSHRDAMDAGAALLWPEEEDLYTMMCMRVEGGRTAFEREKQNVPINPELCEWPEAYFGDWLWFDRWPEAVQLKVLALDPSKGHESGRGDYSAFAMLAVDRRGVLYVDADLARRPTPQIVADGVELCRRFRPDVFGIETNQFQELLGSEFAAEFGRQKLLGIAPWAIENRTNKQTRIRRLGPYLSNRRIRFKSGSPGARLVVEQLKEFPLADHDDGPDAVEMAIRLAAEWFDSRGRGDGLGDRLPLSV